MSLSIYQKGLIIVLVPFAINLAWIGLFWNSLQRSSAWIATNRNEAQVILLLSRSVALFNKLTVYACQYIRVSGDKVILNKVEKDGGILLETLKDLSAATRSDSAISRLTDEIARGVASSEGAMRSIAAEPDPLSVDYKTRLPSGRFLLMLNDAKRLMDILNTRAERFNSTLETEIRDRYRIKLLALGGLLANVMISFALATFLQRSIAGRISVLAGKAHRLTAETFEAEEPAARDELTELDRELLSARRQLLDAYRFRKSFMTIMAAKLQAPLQDCISASLELEKREPCMREPGNQKNLRGLRSNASSCLRLIQDMLLLEGLDAGSLRIDAVAAQLRPVVAGAIELVDVLAVTKKISIENQCEDLTLAMDRARIEQALINLLANAIKFSPPGSSITIETEKLAGKVRISVVDQGPGLDKAVRSRLFQKFYQGAEGKSAGGTGLGLAIAKMIVDAHGGLIGVNSTPGQGSTFWFELPL